MPDPDDYSGTWLCQVQRTQTKMVFVRQEEAGSSEICDVAANFADLMDPEEWDTSELECLATQELTFRELRQLEKHPDQPEVVESEKKKGAM